MRLHRSSVDATRAEQAAAPENHRWARLNKKKDPGKRDANFTYLRKTPRQPYYSWNRGGSAAQTLNNPRQLEDCADDLRSPHLHPAPRYRRRIRGALCQAPAGALEAFPIRGLLAHRVRAAQPGHPRLSL